jgi:hypothetical protein
VRISWDEAAELAASELKRVKADDFTNGEGQERKTGRR